MATGRRGRPRVSSRAQVEVAAFELFLERGYAETSIMDIVAAAGISKTTFFRYFSSKAALVWFPFEESTRDLQRSFGTVDDEVPVMEAIRAGVIDTVTARLNDEGVWTAQIRILDASPELQAEGAQRWLVWSEVVSTFVASRIGTRPAAVVPAAVGGAVQSVVLAVLREGVRSPTSPGEVLTTLDKSLASLGYSLQKWIDEQPYK
ncbi:TetR family transcriptional regulator [Rhodococcus pyridinivorans]|nr:TetR family transcriptional regulator [Rhodococcus pyridinivorans]